jgi:hypothetical protein
VIASILAVAWLGNTALTIWLRETASPTTLRALLSLGFVAYAGWHFAKAAFFRPESPFGWIPAERDTLLALPLRLRDLVAYQLASVTVTSTLKAGLLTLLLSPDLRCVPLGLVGVLLVMLALEILRMAIEIATWGLGRSAFLAYRAAIVAGLVAGGFAVGAVVVREDAFHGRLNVGEGLLQRFLDLLVQSNDLAFRCSTLPFRPFIDLILAERTTPTSLGLAVATLGIVTGLAATVVALYSVTVWRVTEREKRAYHTIVKAGNRPTESKRRELGPVLSTDFRLRSLQLPCLGGATPLAWRQLLGARRRWGSLLTAMIAPSVVACAPCFAIADPDVAFLATAGTLAFYTFLLLPTALRFDFRRDLDRFATLKGLPIRPAAAVVGQTISPVLIATLFQSGVLAFAVVARSLPVHHFFVAVVVMMPLNVLVFSLDNLIFLLYPYRVQQEGLEIFLRMILTFTGKGLLFGVGLAVVSAWGSTAAAVARTIAYCTGCKIGTSTVFAGGLIAGPALLSWLVLLGLCRAYRDLSPIEDIPR